MARLTPRRPGYRPGTAALACMVVACLVGCRTDLERRFQSHIDFLAADALGGRGVGTAGIEQAAHYIAGEFLAAGLEPAGNDGSFLQTFEMTTRKELTDASRLTFSGVDGVGHLTLGSDFTPFGFSANNKFSGSVVLAGFGIVAIDKAHDDFVHLDVKDKIVLMFRGEPPGWADENGSTTPHAMFRNKVYNTKDRGAAGVLIVNRMPEAGESDELVDFSAEQADQYGIPAFHISRSVAAKLVAKLGSLDALQEKLDAGGYVSAALEGISVEGEAGFKQQLAPVFNVVGLLRGDGPLANECIVIGAHYDHLGIRKPRMREFKGGKLVATESKPEIHNGADDNASGTSGLIEIAGMFAAGPRPERSIVFVAFTAEESGLHGSKHFVEHAPFPLNDTIAMINMDMIGRIKPGTRKVQIFGVDCGTGFRDLVEAAGREVGLTVAPLGDPGGRSDHAPFIHNEIPSLHVFSGQHSDYHKPSDDSDKINARGGAKVTRLVYLVARELAARPERPAYVEVKTPNASPGGTPTYRVVMGLAPGYGNDGKPGMAVDAVNPDGPADLAGMKAGDRIVRIGDKPVSNVYDYMAATRNNKAGDTVTVVVLRDGKEAILQVTLSGAG